MHFQAVSYSCKIADYVIRDFPVFGGNIFKFIANMLIIIPPLLIITAINIAIIIRLVQCQRIRQNLTTSNTGDDKTIGMTMMILSITVSYTVLNLPFVVYFATGDEGSRLNVNEMHPAIFLCPFLNAMSNAYLYFFSGSVFREAVFEFFKKVKAKCTM